MLLNKSNRGAVLTNLALSLQDHPIDYGYFSNGCEMPRFVGDGMSNKMRQ